MSSLFGGTSLVSGIVTSGFLGNNSVNTNNISPGSILSGNVGSGQLSAAHLSSGTIIAGLGIQVTANATNITISNLSGSFALTSGIITSGMLGDGSVLSGNVASGQLSAAHLSSGTIIGGAGIQVIANANNITITSLSGGTPALTSGIVQSGMIGDGAVNQNNLASGITVKALDNGTDYTAFGTISGGRCVAMNESGSLITATATSGLYPAFGIIEGNTNSGNVGTVRYAGPFTMADYNFSGFIGKPLYVGLSGLPVGICPAGSGQSQQIIGMALNGSGLIITPSMNILIMAQ